MSDITGSPHWACSEKCKQKKLVTENSVSTVCLSSIANFSHEFEFQTTACKPTLVHNGTSFDLLTGSGLSFPPEICRQIYRRMPVTNLTLVSIMDQCRHTHRKWSEIRNSCEKLELSWISNTKRQICKGHRRSCSRHLTSKFPFAVWNAFEFFS